MIYLVQVRSTLIATLTLLAALVGCSSGKALTPEQELAYDKLAVKHESVVRERSELQQRLEQQFRAHSKAEKSKKTGGKEVAACGVDGRSAKVSLKTFKKRPSSLSFVKGSGGKRGCKGLKVKVKR